MPRQKNTRRLINSESIDRFGLKTYQGTTLVYFLIRPTNLSVLSETAIRQKVQELMLATQAMQEVEWMALDSRENFETNREYLKRRIRQEPVPVLRTLMEKDRAYLDQIQIQTATTREFLVCVRLKNYNEKEVYPYLNRLSKLMEEHGFDVRRADREDVKRLLAVYFTQSVVTEHYDDFDGERWLYGKPVEHPVPRLALPGKKQKKKKRLANWRGGSEQEQQLLDTIEQVLRTNKAPINKKYLDCIRQTAKEYVAQLFTVLRRHEYDPDLIRLVVSGGGACLVKHFGKQKHNIQIVDDLCAAAKGYEFLALKKLEKEETGNGRAKETVHLV